MKIVCRCILAGLLIVTGFVDSEAATDAGFHAWLQSVWPRAQEFGISRATFDLATRGLEPDLSLPDLVLPGRPEKPPPGQPEFVQTPADYLKETTFERLAAQGRKLLDQYREPLERIDARFGVPPAVLLAIFGRETDYGRSPETHNAIRVLATQAYLGKRKDKFLTEFLVALKMLEEGDVKLADMRSSWAGAMGLTQLMPTDYFNYAVDFESNARRRHLEFGAGRPHLGREATRRRRLAARRALGLRGASRRPMSTARWAFPKTSSRSGNGSSADLCRPMAASSPARSAAMTRRCCSRPASMVPRSSRPSNYFAIKEYNFSDLYVLFVGHLSDRILDPRPFETPWAKVAQLPTRDLDRMQHILTERGYYHDKIDGKAGMKTRAALGAYQKRNGLKVDCWPTAAVLAHMEASGR